MRSHCREGHPMEGDNLAVSHRPDGRARYDCRACKRAYQRTRRLAAVPRNTVQDRLNRLSLPAAPLLELLDQTLMDETDLRTYQRAKSTGRISVAKADEWSVRFLARNPIEIYGYEWEQAG